MFRFWYFEPGYIAHIGHFGAQDVYVSITEMSILPGEYLIYEA